MYTKLIKVNATDINPYTNRGRRWEVWHVMALDIETAIEMVKVKRPDRSWIFTGEVVTESTIRIDGWEE